MLRHDTRNVISSCNLFPLQPRQLQPVAKIKPGRKVILTEGEEFWTAVLGFSFSFSFFFAVLAANT